MRPPSFIFVLLLAGGVGAYDVPEMIPTAPVGIGTGDTSVLTSDSLPYTLDTDDRVYILTGNITTTANAISISSGTNRIILDGQGDTVFFATAGGHFCKGLSVHGEESTTDIHIRNITFYHNPDDTLADSTIAVWVAGGVRVLFDTVNIHVFGTQDSTVATWAKILRTHDTNISLYSWMFRGGSWSSLVWGFYSRLSGDGLLTQIPVSNAWCPPADSLYHFIWDNVNISGQGGLQVEGRTWISACSIYVDQRNLRYHYPSEDSGFRASCANQAGIASGEPWGPSRWTNNYIVKGTAHQGMDEGFIINGACGNANSVTDSLVRIDSNYIHVGFRLDSYYGTSLRAKAGAARYGNKNVRIDHNTMIVDVGDTSSGNTWNPNGWGFKYITGGHGDAIFQDTNFVFENNHIEIVAKTATISGNAHFQGIMMSVGDYMDSAAYKPIENGVIFRNNYIKTPEWAYVFGESDGECQYMEITGPDTVEFYVSDASIEHYTIACAQGANEHNFYNYVRDVLYTGTGEPDSLVYLYLGNTLHSAGLKRTVTLFVKDAGGDPVSGADVWFVNAYGDTITETTTNASGLAYGLVKYWDIYSDFTDSTAYNDFTLGAQKAGDSSATTFTVEWDNHTDTLILSATGGEEAGKTNRSQLLRTRRSVL